MYVIDTKGVAILLMIISLCLLGTWPALLCLLERRGKKPQHSFLDYSITNYIIGMASMPACCTCFEATDLLVKDKVQIREALDCPRFEKIQILLVDSCH